MNKSVDWYIGFAREKIDEDTELVKMYEELEKMVRPEWSGDFKGIDDVMSIIDTTPSDAINSGSIAMAGAKPILSVYPNLPNVLEYDRVEGLEDNLMWNFKKSNTSGTGSTLFDMAWSSLLYNGIAVQVYDLMHILPKNSKLWTTRQKRAFRNGRFLFKVRNFKKVHFEDTTWGTGAVVHAENFSVADVIKHWSLFENNETQEGKMAAKALKELKEKLGDDTKTKRFMQYHVMDDEAVCVFGRITDSTEDEDNPTSDIVFAHYDNPVKFSNWSIRVAGSRLEDEPEYKVNPLLAPLYWSKSWEKLNFASSLIFSEPIRRAREPRNKSITMDGKGVQVDRKNGSTVNLRQGEDYDGLQQFTLDPNGMQIINDMRASMNRTTGASVLGDTTQISADTPFATYSAMIKVALSRLDRQRDTIGNSVMDCCYLMLDWVDATNKPLVGYYAGSKISRGTGRVIPQGTMMYAAKGQFDSASLNMECTITPKTPTDEAAQIATAIQLSTQLNVPLSHVLETKLGYDNVGMLYERWVQEALSNAEVQGEIAKIAAYKQTQGQLQAQMEAQGGGMGMGALPGGPTGQEAGMEGGGIANAAFGATQGQTYNPAAGGVSPFQAQPGMGGEAVSTGRSAVEEEIY